MKVKELKELLERFDDYQELILYAECDIEGSKLRGSIQYDYLLVLDVMNTGCAQLFMGWKKR